MNSLLYLSVLIFISQHLMCFDMIYETIAFAILHIFKSKEGYDEERCHACIVFSTLMFHKETRPNSAPE